MKKFILLIATLLLTACSGQSKNIVLTPDTSNNENPSIIQVDNQYYIVWSSTSSGNSDIWITNGDGKTWDNPIQITTDLNQDYYPSLTHKDGVFHLSFFRMDNKTKTTNIWYAKSEDGTNWKEEQITNTNATDWTPRILAHENTLYIVWTSNISGNRDIFITTNDGSGWSKAQQLTNSKLEEDFPYLAFIDGEFYLAWSQFKANEEGAFGSDDSKILVSHSNNPKIWPNSKIISDEKKPSSDTLPAIYSNNGNTYITWTSTYKNKEGDIVRKKINGVFYEYLTKNPYPDYSATTTGNAIVWVSDPENDGINHIINFQEGF